MFSFDHFFASGWSIGVSRVHKRKISRHILTQKETFCGPFFELLFKKNYGRPVQPSPKFLGRKWSYLLPQASLKQFSVVLVHFLILNSQLKIAQKRVHGKSLYSDCVAVRSLIFLLWTLETPIDHPDAKKWSKLNILWGFFEVQNC